MITISDGSTSVQLDDELEWTDEDWAPFQQSVEPGLTGRPIIDIWTLQGMRPITLAASERYAWCLWADYDVLRGWAATPGKELSLTLGARGITFPRVIWRHQDGVPLTHQLLIPYNDRQPDDRVILTRLAFMTLE